VSLPERSWARPENFTNQGTHMRIEMTRRAFIGTSAATLGGLLVPHAAPAAGDSDFHICPKSRPPARTLCAFRTGDLTSFAWDMRLTLSCLQGIVNRSQPRLYLIHDRYDELWLDWLRERGDVDRVEWLEIGEVFERFLPAVSCLYLTDPEVPASINIATMLAGIYDGLVATPPTSEQFKLPLGTDPESPGAGLDLRKFGWKKDIEAYRWAFRQLDGELSRRAVTILAPREVALRDYLVEFKIPILWISAPRDEAKYPQASSKEEMQFAREIMMKWPPNIPCFGWPNSGDKEAGIGETLGVRLASECAKFTPCTAFDAYSPTVGNLSVHSGTTATLRQSMPPVKLQRDKVYFTFIRSDGDGWNFQRHYYRKLFDDPKHGSVPIGWQLGSTAFDGQPDILDYYYKHARPGDCFVNALTGIGYIHEASYAEGYPPEQREKIWQEYLRLSAIYRARIDATVICTYQEMSPERLASIAEMPGIKGVFSNYGRNDQTTMENLVTEVKGVPVFRAVNQPPYMLTFTPSARREAERFTVNEITTWTPPQRPAFLFVFLANWLTNMDMAENIVKALGPQYMAVRPDQLVSLYWQNKKA
jgi:hypothetical protein